jgi:hypothetical protein
MGGEQLMVRRVIHEYYCDQPGCRRGCYFEGTHTQARRYAERIGWTIRSHRRGGKDYCPDHRTLRDRVRDRGRDVAA